MICMLVTLSSLVRKQLFVGRADLREGGDGGVRPLEKWAEILKGRLLLMETCF